jgi:hypothetical protein
VTNVLQGEATARDFDFWIGSWNVRNRRLRERLVGSEDWEEFDAKVVARPLLDGFGNEDEFRVESGVGARLKPGTDAVSHRGFVGMAFRFFDPDRRRWSIYWADSRRPGVLDPPVFGGFSGDVGVFEGDDTHDGTPVRVRFTWTGVAGPTPRWEQAFSTDGGTTWETNWVMDFTRAEGDA